MQKRTAMHWWILIGIGVLAIAAGIFFRLYNLSFPDKQVFDEVYFPVFAERYLTHQFVYDVHPPLGKFLIAIGIAIFGDHPFGWRIIPSLVGVLNIGLFAAIYWQWTKDKVGTLMIAIFVAVDGMFIIYSRVGLMDGMLTAIIFGALWMAMRLKPTATALAAAIVLGLAVAVKWPAAAIIFPMIWFARKEGKLKEFFWALPWAVLTYIFVVYVGQVLNGVAHPLLETWKWHVSALAYQEGLTQTHPWGSPWWSWPIMMRPVLFLYDVGQDGRVALMTTLGNVVLWYSSTVAIFGTFFVGLWRLFRYREDVTKHPLFPMVLGYLVFWLPWAPIKRVLFLYHYFPAYGFALLVLTYWLGLLWKKFPWLVLTYVALVVAVGFLYLPWAVGWITQTPDWIAHLTLVTRWLY